MAELGDFLTQGKRTSREITVEMLDYEYVNKCEAPEELRAILEVRGHSSHRTLPRRA